MARTHTWQEEKELEEYRNGNPLGNTWVPYIAWNTLGVVPVVGPLVHSANKFSRGCYIEGGINLTFAISDMVTFGGFTLATTGLKIATEKGSQQVIKTAVTRSATFGSKVAAERTAKLAAELAAARAAKVAAGRTAKVFAEYVAKGAAERTAKLATERAANAVFQTVGEKVGLAVGKNLTGKLMPNAHTYGDDKTALDLANVFDGLTLVPSQPRQPLTANEARGNTVLPATKIPNATLQDSYFLMYYDLCVKCPNAAAVHGCMNSAATKVFRQCYNFCQKQLSEAVIYMWTDPTYGWYKAINTALLSDNPGLLQHWTPYIRALNYALLSKPVRGSTVARRKSHMTVAQAQTLIAGTSYRLCMYTATSTKSWLQFPSGVGGQRVRWEFEIPETCLQARDISAISALPTEREILLLPYTPVTVRRIDTDVTTGVLTIQAQVAQDGLNLPLDLVTVVA